MPQVGKTYVNEIREEEVSLAIEHLLIAPVGTSAPTARIDIYSSGTYSGFTHLGGVVEDSPAVNINREKYQLETGLPRSLQFDAVTSMSGQFSLSFYNNNNRIARIALGNVQPCYFVSTSGTYSGATLGSTPTNGVLSVTVTTPVSAYFAFGDRIVFAPGGSELTTPTYAYEASEGWFEGVLATTPGTAGTTTLEFNEIYSTGSPVTGSLSLITKSTVAFGTSQIPKYYLIGVADFLDGVQVQHHFYKASPVGDFTENIQPGQAGVISASWDLFATVSSRFNSGSSELILGERFYFPKGQG